MKKLIIITGTGRCGTSLLSGYLQNKKKNLVDQIPKDNSNPHGYFENKDLINLNQKIFKKLKIQNTVIFKKDYTSIEDYNNARRSIRNYLLDLNFEDDDTIVLKDPRISNIIDLWLSVLHKTDINYKIIICYRNIDDFCASYNKTVSIEEKIPYLVWTTRNINCFYHLCSQNIDFEIFNFDNFKLDKNEISKVEKFIELPFKKKNTINYNFEKFFNFDHIQLGKKIHDFSSAKIDYMEFKKFIINSYENITVSDFYTREYYRLLNRNKEIIQNLVYSKNLTNVLNQNIFFYKCQNQDLKNDLLNIDRTYAFKKSILPRTHASKNLIKKIMEFLKKKI